MSTYIEEREHVIFRGIKTLEELILSQYAGNGTKFLGIDNTGKVLLSDGLGQIQSDWAQSNTSALDYIKNKPTIPAAQVNSDWNASGGIAQILNRPTLATVATTGAYSDLTGRPVVPAAQIQADWNQTFITGVDYIKNKPTIPAAPVNADWNATSGLAHILNKPNVKEVRFRIGDSGRPVAGATSFILKDSLNSPITGRKIDLFRDGALKQEGDTIDGFTYDATTGLITLVIAAYATEPFTIKAYSIGAGTAPGGFDYTFDFLLA